jgi:hypothetical protein
MKLLTQAPAALLLATLLSPALADEYQDAVSKAFPGFQILGPSEIKLNKDGMDPEIYNKVKDHPGLTAGRFNSDKVMDFAALIRGSRLIHVPEDKANAVWKAIDYYEGYLVVCLGRAQGGYDCTKMKADPMRILKPHYEFLTKVSPGSQECQLFWKFRPPKSKRNPNMGGEAGTQQGPDEISFSTDAIGLLGSGGVIYIPQPRGVYVECATSG